MGAAYDKNLNAHRYNRSGQGGIRISELEKVLARYHEKYNGSFAVRFISQEISNNIIMEKIKKYRDRIFETNSNIFFLGLFDLCISHNLGKYFANTIANNNRLTCGEFTYELLHDCGALNDYHPKICWPHLFVNNIFDRLQKIKYSELCRFRYV